jgi:hypothetical protein
MPFPTVTNLQFVLRRPGVSIDHVTALSYGLLTATADLPDQSIFPITLSGDGITVFSGNSELIADRLKLIGDSWTDYSLQEMHQAPIFRGLQPGITGGEIAVFETEVPAPAGHKVYAFVGLWRGDDEILNALADVRHSVALKQDENVSVGWFDHQSGEPHLFPAGGIPSEVLRRPIWDSIVGRVCLQSVESINAWRRRTERRIKILDGEAVPQWDESIYRDKSFCAYLAAFREACPELLSQSWFTAEQNEQYSAIAKRALFPA